MSSVGVSACGPGADSTASVVDRVNSALSRQDCVSAYSAVHSVFESASTNNDIRMAMAATYGCYATVNLFSTLNSIATFSGDLGGSGLWELFVQVFPSVAQPDDKIPQSAAYGLDAVMATITPGTITLPSQMIYTDTYNPASLSYLDRTATANAFQTFLAMALVGSLQNRYGLPTANHHKSVSLPWEAATATAGDGCAFAAGLLNFSDGLGSLRSSATGNLANIYASIQSFLNSVLDASCQTGCTLCGGAVSCSTCPLALRNRASCTGLATDVYSCAASGIARMVNLSWQGPP